MLLVSFVFNLGPTMTSLQSDIRLVRRLGRLMLLLTILLAAALAMYAWPLIHSWLVAPSAQPRPITPRGELMNLEKTTIDIFKHASPSVAFITTNTRQYNPWTHRSSEVPEGSGSGFVWDTDGHIVTNLHVIQNASSAQVILYDQSSFSAKVVGYSPDHDLAVLKINVPLTEKLIPLPIGTSHDLQVGQSVFAIGNPFGLDQTLTTGIISALKRSITGESGRPIEDVIQTDAAINPGNSGGPLLDSAGRLIGVNTAIYSPSGSWSGIGFAIPVDTANRVVPDIIATGRYTRGRIGVQFNDLQSEQLLTPLHLNGLAIARVEPNSPADKAGLTGISEDLNGEPILGDVITAVSDQPIKSSKDLLAALDTLRPGDPVTLTLWHNGQSRTLTLHAANLPTE